MTRSNNGMKIRTRRGFSTCNIMVKRINYTYSSTSSVSMCSHLLVCTLTFKHSFIVLSMEWLHLSQSFIPRTLFALHSTSASQYPTEQISLWTCFSVQSVGNFSLPISLIFSCSTAQGKMWRREGEKEELGIIKQGLKKELGVTKLCFTHTTKPYTFLDNISKILSWHGKKKPELILLLWDQNSLYLEVGRMWKRSVGQKENIFTPILNPPQHTRKQTSSYIW